MKRMGMAIGIAPERVAEYKHLQDGTDFEADMAAMEEVFHVG
jgi:L-rhamnose mutarotase